MGVAMHKDNSLIVPAYHSWVHYDSMCLSKDCAAVKLSRRSYEMASSHACFCTDGKSSTFWGKSPMIKADYLGESHQT